MNVVASLQALTPHGMAVEIKLWSESVICVLDKLCTVSDSQVSGANASIVPSLGWSWGKAGDCVSPQCREGHSQPSGHCDCV